ncbi:SDR family oxidoreductase [Chloroflexia bacterium SDU3-3]|nr:SDR family oxidoreductase [Chloroflexia bacterium SDU3-3]
MSEKTVALVTGANRGIGLEVCRQLAQRGITVLLGSRDLRKGEQAASTLARAGGEIYARQLDVADEDSIRALAQWAEAELGHIDILVNNAAIFYDTWQHASHADLAIVQAAFDTNTLGAWRMCRSFLPLLRRSGGARIVNVSSGAGALGDLSGATPAYAISKVALNALTIMLAAELRGSGILVNAVCPGWVATEMGGAGGRPVSEGAAGVVWAATLPSGGPSGGFFRDGRPIAW